MHYDPREKNHGLPHDPFKAIVAPRPIGWISSLSATGNFNLAPYSFYNAVSSDPHLVMFSSVGWKDTVTNIRDTGEFVCNYVGEMNETAMNETSVDAPGEINEATYLGIELTPSQVVKPSRVDNVWAALECKATQIFEPEDSSGNQAGCVVVIGEVVSIYIRDEAIIDGQFEIDVTKPVTRGGYLDFGKSGAKFQMPRPVWKNRK